MHQQWFRRRWVGALGWTIALSAVAAAAESEPLRQLEEGAARAIVFDTGSSEVVVHKTARAVSDLRLRRLTEVGLLAADWEEASLSGSERLLSVSRDGGAGWSRPQTLRFDVALRHHRFDPRAAAPMVPGPLVAGEGNRIFIVQFHTMSLAPLRERLQQLGAELLTAVPEHAHLVRMDPDRAATLQQESFVRWVGPYQPAYRVEAGILAAAAHVPERFVIQTYTPGPAEKRLLTAEIEACGAEVVKQTPNGYLVEAWLTPGQVRSLLHSNHVAWIERWAPPEHDMDVTRESTGADLVESVGGYDGSGVRGEVMDGGIMQFHQDHDGVMFHGGQPDEGRHGTSTYGVVFGNGDRDGDGDAQATGMLPAAQGYFADYDIVLDRFAHTAELVQAPIDAVFQSNSWGSGRTLYYSAISAEMDDIIWNHDIAIFQSQSNAGDQYSRPQAWAKNIVSVGGAWHNDTLTPDDDCWCQQGSTGPAADGRIKPDLTHWADNIYTTDWPDAGSGNYRTNFGGTSAATPITAGAGGLFFEMWADNVLGNDPDGATVFEKRPHVATAKALMLNTAEPYFFDTPNHDFQRSHQGWGRVSPGEFLQRAPLMAVVDEEIVLQDLEFTSFVAEVPPGQGELKVTLVYTDRAGLPSAAVHRINDLTLRVTSPSGTAYWGNHGLDVAMTSSPGGSPNTVDTVENVFVSAPEAGTWRIDVFADEIAMDQHVETPEDDSDFALVVYGVNAFDECREEIAVPTGLDATPGADNAIELSWSGSAPGYRLLRAFGGCGGAFEPVVDLDGIQFSYTDTPVSGGITYGYVVRGTEICESADSNCVEVATTGPCLLEPEFAGLESAGAYPGPVCRMQLDWSEAISRCGGEIRYNVYRSPSPDFTPSDSNRIALCLSETSYIDEDELDQLTLYYYRVRAEDLGAEPAGICGGLEEGNGAERGIEPSVLARWDFETGLEGWMSEPGPIPASTGHWVVGDPVGTFAGTVQPEDCHAGAQCLYTAANPWGNVDVSDVDDGGVQATSPVFDGSGFDGLRLMMRRWHYNRDKELDSGDLFRVEVTGTGSSWAIVDNLDFDDSVPSWSQVSVNLGEFVPLSSTMQVRVRSGDGRGLENLIESAVDDVVIRRLSQCAAENSPPGEADPLTIDRSGTDLVLSWGPDCGAGTRFGVYRGELAAGYGSLAPLAGLCEVPALSATVPQGDGDYFFLVAPHDGVEEGSLGTDSTGGDRPQPASVCHPRAVPLNPCVE